MSVKLIFSLFVLIKTISAISNKTNMNNPAAILMMHNGNWLEVNSDATLRVVQQ